jgi:multiple sugar transport system substrate-binding protein
MKPVHFILAGIIVAVVAVAWFESKPVVSDFDAGSAVHQGFKKAWIEKHKKSDGQEAFRKNWQGRTHITYWEKWGSFEAEAAQKMVDAFNASQDEIFCHYLRTSQVDRKAMLAIVGGSPPDVAGLWDQNVAPFAEANALMPLDKLMAKSGLTEGHYIKNYLKLCQFRGKTYALPSTPATTALFYNKDHFRKHADRIKAAGLDPNRPPRTIDELDRYADAITELNADGTPKVMGFLPTEPGWFHTSWVYFFGGSLVNYETGEITTDRQENIRAFEWIKSYACKYGRTNLTRFRQGFGNYDSPQNAFIDEKVSIVLHGVYFPAFIDRHKPHLKYGVVPFPCAHGVPGPRSVMQEDVLAIPRGCRHPQAAWKFMYFVQTDGLPIICRLQGKHLPITRGPADFVQTNPNRFLTVFRDLARAEHSFIMPQSIVWREYADEITRMFDHIWHWPVPQGPLAGLTGEAKRLKIRELCREEIVKTLRGVRERMTRRQEQKRSRIEIRAQRDAP